MEGRMWDSIVEHVLRSSAEHAMWAPGDSIVVAVSGGPDSVALLHALEEVSRLHTPLRLICAHAHHGFRPEESDEEAEVVRKLANQLDIPFVMSRLEVPAYMKSSGKGPQEAARVLRYRFLHETAMQYGAKSIALAHHGDDQAETVMLHLLRGSGTTGLAGMRPVRMEKNVQLIRPLLRMYKTELVSACEQKHIPYVVDSSNEHNKYRRNAIRMDVLPYLGQYNNQLTESLNRLAEVLRAEDDHMGEEAERVFSELVRREPDKMTIDLPAFRRLTLALQRRVIKLILNYLPSDHENADFHKVEAVRRGFIQDKPTTWSLDLGGMAVCIREYDTASFYSEPLSSCTEYNYKIQLNQAEGTLELPQKSSLSWFLREQEKGIQVPFNADDAVFDAEQLIFPLTIRTRRPGDSVQVMGLKGRKKVKDIFIDAKIPPSVRSSIPVVCDGSGTIVWLPGIRRSIHAPVQEGTSSVIYMSWRTGNARKSGK